MNATLTTRIAAEHAAVAQGLPPGIVSLPQRRRAVEQLLERGLPSSRDDAWKYANLRSLERASFAAAPRPTAPELALPPPIEGFDRYVLVDGHVHATASTRFGRTGGVEVTRDAAAATADSGPGSQALRLALLNEAFAVDALRIEATAETPARGIEIVAVTAADAGVGTSYPRLRIELAPGARLQLVERHLGSGAAASLVNAAVDITVGAGAALEHARLQDCSPRTTWLDSLRACLAADARYHLTSVAIGSQSARSSLEVLLEGADAQLALDAVSVADGSQVHDAYALVRHRGAASRTRHVFRGISAGRARVACNSHAVVEAGAVGVDTRQSLRGLLAGREAEVDLRPQLEIYTDDVRCSHGATAGKLDETMLFYLLSRGLDPAVARALLEWAFLEDVIARLPIPSLRAQLERRLADHRHDPLLDRELLQ